MVAGRRTNAPDTASVSSSVDAEHRDDRRRECRQIKFEDLVAHDRIENKFAVVALIKKEQLGPDGGA